MPILANVILATQIPYVMVLMFCFVVVPVETAIFFVYQRPSVRFWSSVWLVASANAVSWILGALITSLIPVPEGFTRHESRPTYLWGMVIGFVLAYFLSWAIEYQYMRVFRRRFTFTRLSWSVAAANLASYAAILIITLVWY
jgi:hypothetical protein